MVLETGRGRTSRAVLTKRSSFTTGDQVEYWSDSKQRWVIAAVLAVCKRKDGALFYDLSCKRNAPASAVRAVKSTSVEVYQVGDVVEYWSKSADKWLTAKVVNLLKQNPAQVDLDVKPGAPVSRVRRPEAEEEAQEVLRKRENLQAAGRLREERKKLMLRHDVNKTSAHQSKRRREKGEGADLDSKQKSCRAERSATAEDRSDKQKQVPQSLLVSVQPERTMPEATGLTLESAHHNGETETEKQKSKTSEAGARHDDQSCAKPAGDDADGQTELVAGRTQQDCGPIETRCDGAGSDHDQSALDSSRAGELKDRMPAQLGSEAALRRLAAQHVEDKSCDEMGGSREAAALQRQPEVLKESAQTSGESWAAESSNLDGQSKEAANGEEDARRAEKQMHEAEAASQEEGKDVRPAVEPSAARETHLVDEERHSSEQKQEEDRSRLNEDYKKDEGKDHPKEEQPTAQAGEESTRQEETEEAAKHQEEICEAEAQRTRELEAQQAGERKRQEEMRQQDEARRREERRQMEEEQRLREAKKWDEEMKLADENRRREEESRLGLHYMQAQAKKKRELDLSSPEKKTQHRSEDQALHAKPPALAAVASERAEDHGRTASARADAVDSGLPAEADTDDSAVMPVAARPKARAAMRRHEEQAPVAKKQANAERPLRRSVLLSARSGAKSSLPAAEDTDDAEGEKSSEEPTSIVHEEATSVVSESDAAWVREGSSKQQERRAALAFLGVRPKARVRPPAATKAAGRNDTRHAEDSPSDTADDHASEEQNASYRRRKRRRTGRHRRRSPSVEARRRRR
eukprot:TRINITY_DN21485_c1_g1_i7.p1 TRINITY_DN21485_c1_g1~~TRINITY_DN21485_c1_g1_i7.p1  ORF type:complete len:806 (+),score=222.82 TRINITY_DN21485_c1_g1_i7:92-2509(+)